MTAQVLDSYEEMRSACEGATTMYVLPEEWVRLRDAGVRLLVCGWRSHTDMTHLLRELDHGAMALPEGSEITLVHPNPTATTLGRLLKTVRLRRVTVHHVKADPLQRRELRPLQVHTYNAAVVLCDEGWMQGGREAAKARDVQRLDSLLLMVQLNLRMLLADAGTPAIHMVCEKIGSSEPTRFEDSARLPLGVAVNLGEFTATLLAQVAFNPKVLLPWMSLGEQVDLEPVEAGVLANWGEEVTYWQLVKRAQQLELVLLGWYRIPSDVDTPLEVVINPPANVRTTPRVWDAGEGRLKFLCFANRHPNPAVLGGMRAGVKEAVQGLAANKAAQGAGAKNPALGEGGEANVALKAAQRVSQAKA